MTLLESAYSDVSALVREFDEHRGEFLAHNYQESEVRTDFIDKFFTALGWDVAHREQTNPREREVKIEKSDTAGSTRRVDYAFYLKPDYRNPVFFCEAKKPSRDLNNADDYFQLVRYGYGASTPVGALTNFDEFHIIDCRYQPHIEKSYPSAQIKVFGYKDYLDKEAFGYIYWIFSREAVEAGKLKDFAKTLPKQQGKGAAKLTAEEAKPVDEAFLTKLEEYRRILAKAFKKADENLNAEVLTEATQKVIDRLVFIRFLEDKYIESDYIVDQIAAVRAGTGVRGPGSGSGTNSPTVPGSRNPVPVRSAWKSFLSWSKELDVKYNGVVFKPHDIDKSEWKAPDDKTFADLCADISHTHSKYLFTYIPIELLGSIYERFLGKVVTTTAKRAEIEDKPEVRKAGGVYYTPKYIVDYIVANTVGKILVAPASSPVPISPNANGDRGQARTPALQGLSPKEISKLRFADIACGSGSFLIAVYDTVLHHVEKWYNDNPAEAKKAKCTEIEKGIFTLSLKQKQQILLDNIFGVDIDRQAVEVAQLSLFLKLLESESGATAEQISFERTKILPDLSKNIQCGNSLVEYDISDLFPLTDEEEKRIKPFSFQTAFREIMANGGFDAIVGNPPWVDLKGMDPMRVRYYFEHYSSTANRMNEYATFMERSFGLLNGQAMFGMITPSSYLTQSSYSKLRDIILGQFGIDAIIRTPDNTFQHVIAESAIIILSKLRSGDETEVVVFPARAMLKSIDTEFAQRSTRISQLRWLQAEHSAFNLFLDPKKDSIIEKIGRSGARLEEFCEFCLGLTPYDKYKGQSQTLIIERQYHSTSKIGKEWKPLLEGTDITRYGVKWGGKEYIKYGPWLGAPREKRFFTEPRILVRQIISGNPLRIYAGYAEDELYNAQVGFNLLKRSEHKESLFYLLAILNSWLMTWYHRNKYLDPGKNTFQKILIQDAKDFPVPAIDFSNKIQSGLHNLIVKLVDQMLDTKKRLASATSDTDRERHQKKCEYLDGEIDRVVYELYGLTAEEIKIVENV